MEKKLTIDEFVKDLDDYTSSWDYENLHYYMELFPNLFHEQYPTYLKYYSMGLDNTRIIRDIADIDLLWANS